jgi:hypothetical protein
MEWIVKGLMLALCAYLLERLARLLSANRGMQNQALGVIQDQLNRLRATVTNTAAQDLGVRRRVATLLQEYQATLGRLNDIEGRKNTVLGALEGLWNTGRRVLVGA